MTPAKPTEIPLLVVGCDFRNAAVCFREQLVTTPEQRAALFHGINSIEKNAGFAALETCNRVEWIASTETPEWAAQLLCAQMMERWQAALPEAAECPVPYVHTGRKAARHLLRVAAGLESLAEGEAQIAGQFQDALRRAREEATSSPVINGLSAPAGRLAKVGCRIGFRSDHRRGIHGLTAEFLRSRLADGAGQATVVVAGMGKIGRKTAEVLDQQLHCKVVRINRTVKAQHAGAWRSLDELPQALQAAQALVVATGGLTPVIQPEQLRLNGKPGPLLVIDIGIPRQVSPAAQQLAGIEYYSLDDLVEFKRPGAACRPDSCAEQEVEKELRRFKRFCIERNVVTLLEEAQLRRREFIQHQIPALVANELGELDARMRKQVEALMKQLISDYSVESFNSIHKALEQYWSGK